MLSIYPAYFIKDQQGCSVIFPDWNDAASYGKNFNEAMEMAIDCLAGLIFTKKLEGNSLPEPSSESKTELHRIAKEYQCDANIIESHLVSVDADKYARDHFEKTVKKTITILEWQNTEGMRRGINFSKICQDALTNELVKKIQQTPANN